MGRHGGRLGVSGHALSHQIVRDPGEQVPLVLLEALPAELKPDLRQTGNHRPDLDILDRRLLAELASGGLGRRLACVHPSAGQVPEGGLIGMNRILRPEQQHTVARVEEDDARDLSADRSMLGHGADCV